MGRVTSVLLVSSAVVVATSAMVVFVAGDYLWSGAEDPVNGSAVNTAVPVGSAPKDLASGASQVGYTPMPEGATYVRVWDLGKKYTYKHYWPTEQWADRANWTQVPYGQEENYEFQGDCMLEGPNFWVSLHSSTNDACFLYNKVDQWGTPSRHNEMYRSYDGPDGLRTYCSGYEYNKIIRNEIGDIIVESATRVRYRKNWPDFPVQIVNRYRVQACKPWLEIYPITMASEQGMHGESRIHISPDSLSGGQDFLADSWKNPPSQSVYHPHTSRMLLDLIMDDDCIWAMMWKTVGKIPPSSHPYYNTRSRSDNCSGGYPAGWQRIGEGTSPLIFTAPFVKYRDEKMVIGVLRIGHWHYQKINAAVQANQDYTGQFRYAYQRRVTGSPFSPGGRWWPMYPGKWRMIGRINGQYYTQEKTVTQADVGQSNFTFHCPAAGTLEYIVFYLYDRTDQTPRNLHTLMDIYRTGALEMVTEPAGRYVFYNNSSFDGNDSSANANDDNAVATDKTALLPGRTATFANYTSYSRGINGIMVDIPNLPTTPEIAAEDFTFKAGNDNYPDQWPAASVPSSVTVRRGAGVGGSDRITIIWADNAIRKQWLQVTVKSNIATGLARPDVFYFGNAVGDSGNDTTNTAVTTMDEMRARLDPHKSKLNPAGIENPHDYNRSGAVNTMDEMISRLNTTTLLDDLSLITAP